MSPKNEIELPGTVGKLTFREIKGRLEIGHDGPSDGSGAYDWSCLLITKSEAKALAAWLNKWSRGVPPTEGHPK